MNSQITNDVVDKFLASKGLKVNGELKIPREQFNSKVLAPICIMDVAYGMLQKVFAKDHKHEAKKLINRIRKIFSERIYAPKGLFYEGLNEDDVMYLSDLSDKQSEQLENTLDKFYWFIHGAAGHGKHNKFKETDMYCNILIASTLVKFAQVKIDLDWKSKSSSIDQLMFSLQRLNEVVREKYLLNKDGVMINTDYLAELFKEINEKMALA